MRRDIVKKRKLDKTKAIAYIILSVLLGCMLYTIIDIVSCTVKASAETDEDYKYNIMCYDNKYVIPLHAYTYKSGSTEMYGTGTFILQISTSDIKVISSTNGTELATVMVNNLGTIYQSNELILIMYAMGSGSLGADMYASYGAYVGIERVGTPKFQELREVRVVNGLGWLENHIVQDENNYYKFTVKAVNTSATMKYYLQNTTETITTHYLLYNENYESIIKSGNAYDYWYNYIVNNNLTRDEYSNYYYNLYYNEAYDEAKEYYLDLSENGNFMSLVNAITFGAIKPVYSLLNFNLLGINLWNLFTAIFTIMIIALIISVIAKFIK